MAIQRPDAEVGSHPSSAAVPTPVEFLTARLDELERRAKSANVGHSWSYNDRTMSVEVGSDSIEWQPSAADHAATCDYEDHWECSGARLNALLEGEHIVAWQPAFVLADIAAKRAVIAIHHPANLEADGTPDPYASEHDARYCQGCMFNSVEEYASLLADCPTVLALIQPFAEHPDYQESWRPPPE